MTIILITTTDHFKMIGAFYDIAPRRLIETSVYFNETTRRYILDVCIFILAAVRT
jgi:hypothetical protein